MGAAEGQIDIFYKKRMLYLSQNMSGDRHWKNRCYSPIRKNKDYVYGIWVYKALGIWKGY